MEKTAKQIEKDVFRIIKDSELKNVIGGEHFQKWLSYIWETTLLKS